jgi:hypothetical protein
MYYTILFIARMKNLKSLVSYVDKLSKRIPFVQLTLKKNAQFKNKYASDLTFHSKLFCYDNIL